jgi:protein prenyltransferase alpha subunit repeat containing protein 1
MSRALDHGDAAAVLVSDPQAAYNDLIEALNSNTSEILEIEFLGRSHPLPPGCNVLVDGASIAIPKLKLIQAFVLARQIFFECLKDFKEANFEDIRNSTTIILLMDPEHITAANARKKIVQAFQAGSKSELEVALRRELLVIDSFLTSRLHRHTKSPTLWGHRRWLLQIFTSISLRHDMHRDLTSVVLVAAERHPRNYYAWLHMRWILQALQGRRNDSVRSLIYDQPKMISVVKNWCLRHPTDTSGWSFLLFCLFFLEASETSRVEANSSICKEVLGLARSFQWAHESVWVFLRTLVASGQIEEDQKASFFETIEAIIAAQAENSKAQTSLQAAREWCIDYIV